jgi:purine nucleosidase
MIPVIIDTDTASDDAVAIIMALRTPHFDVKGITVVAGNVPLAQASRNACYTVELCGSDVPVWNGAARPLLREAYSAEWFHGADGLGGTNYPAPKKQPEPGHAVDALITLIKANPGCLLITLGPLTNVALALAKAPEIAKDIGRCVVMGGAANTVGNVTPAAEYNIWCDPEAARMVFHAGIAHLEMVGWELCRGEASLYPDEMRYLKEDIATPLAHFSVDTNWSAFKASTELQGDPGLGLADPVAMAVAIDPTIATRKSAHYVEIECEGTFTRGMTVVDGVNVIAQRAHPHPEWNAILKGEPNVTVCWELDVPRWKALLYDCLK